MKPQACARYSIRIKTESEHDYRYVPYGMSVDFGEQLKEKGTHGTFDPDSVRVYRIQGDEEIPIPFNFSADFMHEARGMVWWLIADTKQTDYRIRFDIRENGPYPEPEKIELVGNGDCLRYNDGLPHPLHVGMVAYPVAMDFDGDGITDIITPQIYNFTYRSPEHVLKFYKNEGTNESPVFGEGQYLKDTDGEYLKCGWPVELWDIDGNGLQDLITCKYGYDKNALTVYRNTGKTDAKGFPVYEKGRPVMLNENIDAQGMIGCIKIVINPVTKKKDVMIGRTLQKQYVQLGEPLFFSGSREGMEEAQWPRWYIKGYIEYFQNIASDGDSFVFAPPVVLRDDQGEVLNAYGVPYFDITEKQGNGFDLLMQRNTQQFFVDLKGRELVHYTGRNLYNGNGEIVGSFQKQGSIPGLYDRNAIAFHSVSTPAFTGLLYTVRDQSGHIRYAKRTGTDANGIPTYEDKGELLQKRAYVNTGAGYSQGVPVQWNDRGVTDILAANEIGHVMVFYNKGDDVNPVYAEAEYVTADGQKIELENGPWDCTLLKSFGESALGQMCPMYTDWDLDGVKDLLLVVGQRLLFYKNTGTDTKPVFAKPLEIRTKSGNKVIRHRSKPIVADWNNDGLPDIIGHETDDQQLLFFERKQDEHTGELFLEEGIPLVYEDGQPLNPHELWHHMKYFNTVDWNGNGKPDIIAGVKYNLVYLENAGHESNLVFKSPVKFTDRYGEIRIGYHVSTPYGMDWDKTGTPDLLVSSESGLFHRFRRHYLEQMEKGITAGWMNE